MLKEVLGIKKCQNCLLYKNQKPLLDNIPPAADVIFLGLSAKYISCAGDNRPLGIDTLSGKVLRPIESGFPELVFYASNLVKCLPLRDNLKLRYPQKSEIDACINNFKTEVDSLKPAIIFLLGNIVSKSVALEFGIKINQSKLNADYKYQTYKVHNHIFVPIHHPSYISVYKRKEKDRYLDSIKKLIKQHTAGRAKRI